MSLKRQYLNFAWMLLIWNLFDYFYTGISFLKFAAQKYAIKNYFGSLLIGNKSYAHLWAAHKN